MLRAFGLVLVRRYPGLPIPFCEAFRYYVHYIVINIMDLECDTSSVSCEFLAHFCFEYDSPQSCFHEGTVPYSKFRWIGITS